MASILATEGFELEKLYGATPWNPLKANVPLGATVAAAAQLARLEYEKRMGELLEAEEVKQAIIKNVSITRETLLNIPDRVAPVLLSQTDLHTVTEILRTEIHNALVSLSDLEAG